MVLEVNGSCLVGLYGIAGNGSCLVGLECIKGKCFILIVGLDGIGYYWFVFSFSGWYRR